MPISGYAPVSILRFPVVLVRYMLEASMADETTYIKDLVRIPGYYLKGVYREVNEKAVFLWAQAIAFKVLVTIVPIVILATGIVGRILSGDQAFQSVASYVREMLPDYRSEEIIRFLEAYQNASTVLSVIGVLGLLFAAMTLFTTLRVVISNVFQEDWRKDRTILGGYGFDIRMAAQVGLFFLLSLGLSVLMQSLSSAGSSLLHEVGLDYPWIQEGWGRIFTTFGLLLPFLLTVGMFFQLFYFIPKPKPPKRSAFIGAMVTSFLWELAKYLFTFYASRVGRFEGYVAVADGTNAAEGGLTMAFVNTFGLILAFVFWVYYSGVVLIIGATVALLHEKRHQRQTIVTDVQHEGRSTNGGRQISEKEEREEEEDLIERRVPRQNFSL